MTCVSAREVRTFTMQEDHKAKLPRHPCLRTQGVSRSARSRGEPVTPHVMNLACSLELRPVPRPVQQPHPPILIGSTGRRMVTLAAREADIILLFPPVEEKLASK